MQPEGPEGIVQVTVRVRRSHPGFVPEFRRIRREHLKATVAYSARVTLGASVIRVFNSGTKKPLMNALRRLPVERLGRVTDQRAYRRLFERWLHRVEAVIDRHNRGNERIHPGIKWGHSTKVLSIFLREVVSHTRLFNDSQVRRIEPLLYVPVDQITMKNLQKTGRSEGYRLRFKRIKEIDTSDKFYEVQETLGRAAIEVGVPRVWFDDGWGMREQVPRPGAERRK